MKQLLLVVLVLWWGTQAAPKRCKPEKAYSEWFHIPESKSKKQKQAEEDFGESLRRLVETNKLSAQEAMTLFEKAHKCGLRFASPVQNRMGMSKEPGKASQEPGDGRDKNASRTLKRFLRKRKMWGEFYWAKIPVWKPKQKKIEEVELPFLLPHEWLSTYFYQPGAMEEAMPERGTYKSQRLAEACRAWGEPENGMVPLGLHGDGVPVQGRMNQSSVDFFTINLPCSEQFGSYRTPIVCLESRYNAGEQTCNAITQVIAWSLQKLSEGQFPTARHNGEAWLPNEQQRQKLSGQSMPAKACLIEMRSDWDWNCKYYQAPQWNVTSGCCWLCSVKPEAWKGLQPEERQNLSLNKAAYLATVEARGRSPSPLFQLHAVSNWTMLPDWMHVVDEGVGSLAAGQVLWELLPHYPASQQEARVGLLWTHIQDVYQASNWPAEKRLPKLTIKDIKKPGKAAELDVKAAQCRYFVPLLEILARQKEFHIGTNRQKGIYNVAKFLGKMYAALENGDKTAIASNGYKFISQYMALETHAVAQDASDTQTWRMKPKFHLLGHLLDEACKGLHPKDVWNYRDETFAGEIQKLWYKRGELPSPKNDSEKVLLRWCNAHHPWSLKKAA